jgi:hypothetical protein
MEMDFTSSQIEQAVKIDRNALDDAIIEQASLYFDISEKSTNAISKRDAAKVALDQLCAETSLFIRQNPSKFSFKQTESSIADAVLTNPTVKEAQALYLEAKGEADFYQNAQATFEMRAKALHDLVTLFTAGYFLNSGEGGYANLREVSRHAHRNPD